MIPCPTCSEPAAGRCRCPLAHQWCESGHEWHLCPRHSVAVAGPADHRRPCECSCGKKEGGGESIFLQESHPSLGPD